jgi:CMP-N,N'-diacetyllegionaminic acid synthase
LKVLGVITARGGSKGIPGKNLKLLAGKPLLAYTIDTARRINYQPDAVMILQPTSPLRTAEDIAAAVTLLDNSGADSVLSVNEVPVHSHPMRTLRLDSTGHAALFVSGEPVRKRINRRQDLPPAWVMNGAIYACRTRVLFDAEPSLYGDRVVAYRMPANRSISIDDLEDWHAAERALSSRQ